MYGFHVGKIFRSSHPMGRSQPKTARSWGQWRGWCGLRGLSLKTPLPLFQGFRGVLLISAWKKGKPIGFHKSLFSGILGGDGLKDFLFSSLVKWFNLSDGLKPPTRSVLLFCCPFFLPLYDTPQKRKAGLLDSKFLTSCEKRQGPFKKQKCFGRHCVRVTSDSIMDFNMQKWFWHSSFRLEEWGFMKRHDGSVWTVWTVCWVWVVWNLQHFLRGITKILKPLGPGAQRKPLMLVTPKKLIVILLMAEILHHLGCMKPYK